VSKSSDRQLFDLYERLDRLEEMLEDMDELGVSTRDQIEQVVIALDQQIEELESAVAGDSDD
jgi:RecA/RadA recombinase